MAMETAFPLSPDFFGSCFPESPDVFSLLDSPVSDPSPAGSAPCSAEENAPAPSAADERKRRRMISNRESARRSRMRKQRHLEDLHSELSRLRSENREMLERLAVVSRYCRLLWRDNDFLGAESVRLRLRLAEFQRFLVFPRLQEVSVSNARTHPQLIA